MTNDPAETAWAAGLFEGEGCVSMGRSAHGNRRPWIYMTLTMVDEDTVRRFADIMDAGGLRPKRLPSGKIAWTWQMYGQLKVREAFEAFRPWLGARRIARFEELLEITAPIGNYGRKEIAHVSI